MGPRASPGQRLLLCGWSGLRPQSRPSSSISTSALLSQMPCFWYFPTYIASSATSRLEPIWEELVCILVARIHFPPVIGRRCSAFLPLPLPGSWVVLGSAWGAGHAAVPPLGLLRWQHPGKVGTAGCPSPRPAPGTACLDAPPQHLIQAARLSCPDSTPCQAGLELRLCA